jgi:hypothetical protein
MAFRIMIFGIMEFRENVHFGIKGFGIMASGKGIFGKLGFGKSYCNHLFDHRDSSVPIYST